ncbi:unnamed protein product [Prorocentrum cordatum]|uniref:Uncharacterized protein n=1 Tax=Prorocentrum cordatum TaxID=2364126 RepID=A0ABN9SMS8_9DINO|nr:unnamed protein product [Polarella glacialis]|mmetsp:Transcript_60094/g.156008  ORF Transcript_60094/g.156008 Transcript_60094/m.156008 type:complete len:199 (+) Transcript_60094:63-659(+)
MLADLTDQSMRENLLPRTPHKHDEADTPTASTMTFQGQGCGDHLCEKAECTECVDDRFKPLLEFEFLDRLGDAMLTKLRELGWGPEMGSLADYFDEHGDSLLHSAARRGEAPVVKVLLEQGVQADTRCQGECCCTPLMVASRWCRHDCVGLLLDHGADISQVNYYNETAIDHVNKKAIGAECDRQLTLSVMRDRGARF